MYFDDDHASCRRLAELCKVAVLEGCFCRANIALTISRFVSQYG